MLSRLARALASAGGLGALLAGLPWALLTVIGNPLTGLPPLTQSWITGPVIQHLIALAVWLLWAIFVAAIGVEAVAVARGVNAPRLAVLSRSRAWRRCSSRACSAHPSPAPPRRPSISASPPRPPLPAPVQSPPQRLRPSLLVIPPASPRRRPR